MFGDRVSKLGVVSGRSQIQRAIASLRARGTNAHVWLPGIGVLNGITAGNYLDSAGTTPATVDNPVGKVADSFGGINATQATTGNKPTLRLSEGKYSWQFDGTDDFLLASENTGLEGLIIAGVKPSISGWKMFAGSGAQSGANPGVRLGIEGSTSKWLLETANGASSVATKSSSVAAIGTTSVVTGSWSATSQKLRVNGVQVASAASSISASQNGLAIGAGRYYSYTVGDAFAGSIYPVIAIKGTVTDAELLLYEKLVAALSGITI